MSFYWRVGFGISEHFDPLIIFFCIGFIQVFTPFFSRIWSINDAKTGIKRNVRFISCSF